MSVTTQPTRARQPELRINIQEVIDRLHDQYARTMAPMMQENAELYVSLETAKRRILELEAQVAALRPAPPAAAVKVGTPG